jgi:hypothetical protein
MSNHNTFYYNDNNPSFIPYSTTYNDISLININWTDVISKPSFCNICLTANYNNLSNVPNLSVYASNIDVSNVSNILFINSSNSNINTSNNVITFTNNTIGTIKTSQWNSINSNIYYNEGNVGIGSSVFGNDKLIVTGIINSDEYQRLIKTQSNGLQPETTRIIEEKDLIDRIKRLYFKVRNVECPPAIYLPLKYLYRLRKHRKEPINMSEELIHNIVLS